MKPELQNLEGAAQKRETVIINRPFVTPQKSCARCTEPSGMITPDEAAALCEVSTRTIYHWLDSGAIHFSETMKEGLLICLRSLASTSSTEAVQQSNAEDCADHTAVCPKPNALAPEEPGVEW